MIINAIFIGFIILTTLAILYILEAKIRDIQEELRTTSYLVDYNKFVKLDSDISYYSTIESFAILGAILLSSCIIGG